MTSVAQDRRYGVNAGKAIKVPCIAASTANLTLSGTQTIDGVAVVADDRVFVKDQDDGTENGIYIVSSGSWSRAPDWDDVNDVVQGTLIPVNQGTTNATSIWRVTTTGTITPGTTDVSFSLAGLGPIATTADAVTYTPEGTGAVATDVQTKLREVVSVMDFGATGDGVADDTEEIQAAVTAAGAKSYGGAVYFPPGNYLISDTIAVPQGVRIWGDAINDPDDPGSLGATFHVTHTATPAVTILDGCKVDGLNFWYPDQVTTSPPTAYDYAIELDLTTEHVQGVTIENCILYNAYNGINLGGASGGFIPGNTHIKNIRGYCINTGIRVGYTLVNLFATDCTFSTEFWPASSGQAVRTWSMANGEAIYYSAGTGMYIDNLACFGLKRGIFVDGDGSNGLTFFKLNNSIIDGCNICIAISGDGAIQGGTITGTTLSPRNGLDDTDDSCVGLYCSENALVNKLQVSNCYFGAGNGNHVQLVETTTGIQAWVQFTGCVFEQANSDGNAGTHYNIFLNDDLLTVLVNGCFFRNNTTDVICVKSTTVRDLTVADCQFYGSHDTAIDLTAVVRNCVIHDNWSAGTNGSASITLGTIGTLRYHNNIWDVEPSQTLGSADPLVLNEYHDFYKISGTTTTATINGGWKHRRVTLQFTDATPGDLTDNSGNLRLEGNFSPSQYDLIRLYYDGTNWYEEGRVAISS